MMKRNLQIEKVRKRLLIGSVGMAILFMAFGSYGSFNPLSIGFYTSTGAALLWYYLNFYGIKWLTVKEEKK